MEILKPLYIIGIAVRTTNENQQSATDIPFLWQQFFEEKITDQIPNKISDRIYSIYTDYEKDFTKPYTTIIGCEVDNIEEIPNGLIGKEIAIGNYEKISIQGNLHNNIVINEWNKIWNSNLNRAYTTDFECYTFSSNQDETQVDIYISI